MAGELNEVNEPIQAYHDMARYWPLHRALWNGTRGMREAGELLLPKWSKEELADYCARLESTTLFNAYRRAINNLTGRVFSKPIQVEDSTPPKVKAYMENVDLQGNNLDQFGLQVFRDAIQTGKSHFMVEMQPNPDPKKKIGRLEDQKLRRPYMVHYPSEDVIGWRVKSEGGVQVLDQVRVRERAFEESGRWGVRLVSRVRVLSRGGFELYVNKSDDPKAPNWQLETAGETSLNYIPFVSIFTERTGFMEAEPALEDLAQVNRQWWCSESDQRVILHFARVPILFAAGMTANEIQAAKASGIGGGAFFTAEDYQAKLEICEHSGAAIAAGEKDQEKAEARMALLSLEPVIRKPGDLTAKEVSVTSAEANCSLGRWALSLEDGLELGAQMMADYGGEGAQRDSVSLAVNRDFGLSDVDHANAELIGKLWIAGKISDLTAYEQLQHLKTFSDNFDAKTEEQRIRDQNRANGNAGPGVDLGGMDPALLGGAQGGNIALPGAQS